MRKAIILTALVLMFILSTTSAFAMVGAEKPPEGMVGITSVDEGTSPENPSNLPPDAELVNRADKPPTEGEGMDPNIATSSIAEDTDMGSDQEPLQNLMDRTSENPEQSTMELSIASEAGQVLTAADGSTNTNNKPVTVYYLVGASILAAILFVAAVRKRSVRQGA